MSNLKSEKLRSFAPSIFTELLYEKRAALANGRRIIDLSVGSPDMSPPKVVIDTLKETVQDASMYGYALTGIPEFSDAVSYFYNERYGVSLNPKDEVLQLMGSQDGLSHLMMAILNPGDIVLSPDPGYTVYESSIRLAQGELYPMPLFAENGFLPNLSDIPAEIADKAKIMIINYPGNPVTALAPASFFEEVIAFARKHDILIVHDFAYSELVFDKVRPISFLSIPGAKEVGVEFNSLSKTFSMAGCRIGYVVGNPEALEVLALFKSHVDYGTFLPIQKAGIAALTKGISYLDPLMEIYTKRRDALHEGLHRAGWPVEMPPATMFMWARIPEGWNSRDFTFELLHHTGVVVTPGNAFGGQGEGYVRIALVQSPETLIEAAERIGQFLKTHEPLLR
jgi:LL-diaminopimelate aminotransferase